MAGFSLADVEKMSARDAFGNALVMAGEKNKNIVAYTWPMEDNSERSLGKTK